MRPGNTVRLYSNATNNGKRAFVGVGTLIKKIGTITDYWEVDLQGQVLRFFVRPEDRVSIKDIEVKVDLQPYDPKAPRRPKLRVIQGGATDGSG